MTGKHRAGSSFPAGRSREGRSRPSWFLADRPDIEALPAFFPDRAGARRTGSYPLSARVGPDRWPTGVSGRTAPTYETRVAGPLETRRRPAPAERVGLGPRPTPSFRAACRLRASDRGPRPRCPLSLLVPDPPESGDTEGKEFRKPRTSRRETSPLSNINPMDAAGGGRDSLGQWRGKVRRSPGLPGNREQG